MLNILLYLFIVIVSVIFMEIVAIFTHKYIMHGVGWFLHKSHHTNHDNKFELNDFYFVIFSLPSMFSIIYGLLIGNYILLSMGIGILIYGLIYIFLHDMYVHNRLGIKIRIESNYLKKIKKSHQKHHSVKSKNGASNFGFITYK